VVCREGTMQLAEILGDVAEGRGRAGDVDLLLELAEGLAATGGCALGRAAAQPVVRAVRESRAELDAHAGGKACPSGACGAGRTAP
jgi:NADH-quinone oxidoreductase subunit F